jgi:hypothetical protein
VVAKNMSAFSISTNASKATGTLQPAAGIGFGLLDCPATVALQCRTRCAMLRLFT